MPSLAGGWRTRSVTHSNPNRVARGCGCDTCRAIDKVTSVVADVIERDAHNVHVFYAEDGAGRVAFGGSLVE